MSFKVGDRVEKKGFLKPRQGTVVFVSSNGAVLGIVFDGDKRPVNRESRHYKLATSHSNTQPTIKTFKPMTDEDWIKGFQNHLMGLGLGKKPSEAKPMPKSEKHDCTTMGHVMVDYVGFTEAYKTCKHCPCKA